MNVTEGNSRKSSVPDCEFHRTESLEEIFELAGVGVRIMCAVADHQAGAFDGSWEIAMEKTKECLAVRRVD